MTKKYRLFKACKDFFLIQLSNYRADGQAVITLPEICGCLMVVAEEG